MIRRFAVLSFFASFGLLSSAAAGRALSPVMPYSYTTSTPDGRHQFVMLAQDTPKTDVGRQLKNTYSRSGMYGADGSPQPLWTVDWYAFKVHVASETHVVRLNSGPLFDDSKALAFFAAGQELRTYSVRELMDLRLFLPERLFHYSWLDSDTFDNKAMTYSIWTYDHNHLTFDVRTGEIVGGRRYGAAVRYGIVAIAVLCLVAVIRSVKRCLRTRQATHRGTEHPGAVDSDHFSR